ncbi:RNAse [Komagataella phaffii GS115]|uniref:Ribonuclease T2-like n=2 Tax=Komagataella phaffii TaxID=460519 RepID=C4QZY8_KOMPG|nr:RNAse [Komagataella phaffii GS115]AOA63082.1 GQ67_00232T0 [Komagataella phaffii]AOA67492.1 GQ68_01156T0 [Komagataella phaffii GS115]CAY68812.1 RNAse [Komagataella phaffii GS115]
MLFKFHSAYQMISELLQGVLDHTPNPIEVPQLPNQFPLSTDYCPIDVPLTCSNKTEVKDTCCFEHPGGVLVLTQFWNYYPAIGPDKLFTLHGLWPDNCDGSYDQFCSNSDTITEVSGILRSFGEEELLEKMKQVWKNNNHNDEQLWIHEFNKHATCMTTIQSKCYDQYEKHVNVVDFFRTTVAVFETVPTYDWLANNGIVPSTAQTYSRQQIEDTLTAQFGQPVRISCNKYGALDEVWYFHHLKGSVRMYNNSLPDLYPIPALAESRCPEHGIKYLPKDFKPPAPTHTQPNLPRPTDGVYKHGYLKLSGQSGCLISTGKWYTSGTCATFQLFKAPFGGYNLKSSKGFCGVTVDGELICHRGQQPIQFEFDKSKNQINYGGVHVWSAFNEPSRFEQIPIFSGRKGSIVFKLILEE